MMLAGPVRLPPVAIVTESLLCAARHGCLSPLSRLAMERMWTTEGTTPEEYLQRTSLRPMLASMLERTCKDKPDNLIPFMLEYLQTTYPDASQSANPINAPGSFGTWARRTDVQPTEAGLQAYLTQIKARATLESVLEQALHPHPRPQPQPRPSTDLSPMPTASSHPRSHPPPPLRSRRCVGSPPTSSPL